MNKEEYANKLKNCFLIYKITNKEKQQIVVYRSYLDDILDILNFEENRFFPVIKTEDNWKEIFDKGDFKNDNQRKYSRMEKKRI